MIEFSVMNKAFCFRAYPNKVQEQTMVTLLETHRKLYNSALSQRKYIYEAEQRAVTYREQSAQLKIARKDDETLALCNFSSCQRTLKRLERAFQAFFRRIKSGEGNFETKSRKAGYPRFRSFGRFDSVDFTIGDGAKLTKDGKAYFQNVGEVKLKLHRAVEGTIKTATFQRHAGNWYVVFVATVGVAAECNSEVEATVVEPSTNPAPESPPQGFRCIGIDLGLKSFLVTSEGEIVDAPKLYRKAQSKLRRSQRALARKKRNGANRRKAVKTLARIHAHIANQRRDFHHKTAKSLVDRYSVIGHEDLNVRGMIRCLNLAKSVHDAGWSQFLTILRQKAESAAVLIVSVNPRHTTQTCSRCGCLPSMPINLSIRTYKCEHCNLTLDRDFNAAINILQRSRLLWSPEMANVLPANVANRAGILPLQANVVGYDEHSARSLRLGYIRG